MTTGCRSATRTSTRRSSCSRRPGIEPQCPVRHGADGAGRGAVGTGARAAGQAAGVNISLRQVTVTDFFGPNYLKWTFSQDTWEYFPYFPMVAFGELRTRRPTRPTSTTRPTRSCSTRVSPLPTPRSASRSRSICRRSSTTPGGTSSPSLAHDRRVRQERARSERGEDRRAVQPAQLQQGLAVLSAVRSQPAGGGRGTWRRPGARV